MKKQGLRAIKASVRAQEKATDGFIDALFSGLVEQREQLTGQPSPPEIAERLQKVFADMRWYHEAFQRLDRQEFRFLLAILLTREFWPERMPAVEAALEPCFEIVDEAWVSVDVTNRKVDMAFFRELWAKVCEIAARRVFQKQQAEARERLARRGEAPAQ